MAVKNISTRMKICGRTAKCTGGHSAVEQSGYISREIMYSEYDGKTYYPKYAEDLVHNEVLLPENAPEEYKDPKNYGTLSRCSRRKMMRSLQELGELNFRIIGHISLQSCF